LPWRQLPRLILPGVVIAVAGFADAVTISRHFASKDRQRWDANREFLSKGLADVVSGLTSGLPLGGSLSRTSVNRLAGAHSRWSGLVTGVAVLMFLPFAGVLGPLPIAVLSGIVIAAIWSLIRPVQVARLWVLARPQALVGWGTFALTLILAPHIEQGILLGVGLSAAVHLWRELSPRVPAERDGDTLFISPSGVFWFGSAPAMEDGLFARLAEEPDVTRVVIRCGGLGRIDLTGAHTLAEMVRNAEGAGIEMTLVDVPAHATRVLRAVGVPAGGDTAAGGPGPSPTP
jgi:SulP family sulfate permease